MICHLSYEDPYKFVEFNLNGETEEWNMKIKWTAEIQILNEGQLMEQYWLQITIIGLNQRMSH